MNKSVTLSIFCKNDQGNINRIIFPPLHIIFGERFGCLSPEASPSLDTNSKPTLVLQEFIFNVLCTI